MSITAYDIFSFTDWQSCLQEWLAWRKGVERMSLQILADRIGIRAKSNLHRAIHTPGQTLSKKLVDPICKVMDLDRHQKEYFTALCNLSRAKTIAEREKLVLRLGQLQGKNTSQTIRQDQSDYFQKWYLPALREAVLFSNWNGNFTKLANWFTPKITAEQARQGVELLVRIGLLERITDSQYRQVDSVVDTQSHAEKAAVLAFQKEMLKLGESAFKNISPQKREMSTVTFSFPATQFFQIQETIREFQERIARESVATSENHNAVYQLNVQCFPLAIASSSTKESK